MLTISEWVIVRRDYDIVMTFVRAKCGRNVCQHDRDHRLEKFLMRCFLSLSSSL